MYLFEDEHNSGDPQLIQTSHEELEFLKDYYLTYNRHWLSTYPRPQPVIPYIAMNDDNDRTKWVDSTSYFWTCEPSDNQKKKGGGIGRILSRHYNQCQDTNNGKPIELMIERQYKTDPQIYTVSNFISETEANHIIELSRPNMKRSTTGNGVNARVDPTRTCSNTWLPMNKSKIIETIYHRIGDVLGIEQYKMNVDSTVVDHSGNIEGVASHMEVVHFDTNEHYSRLRICISDEFR